MATQKVRDDTETRYPSPDDSGRRKSTYGASLLLEVMEPEELTELLNDEVTGEDLLQRHGIDGEVTLGAMNSAQINGGGRDE